MTIIALAAMAGLSLGGLLGFIAAALCAMAKDADAEINNPGPDDDGSLWPRNSKGL